MPRRLARKPSILIETPDLVELGPSMLALNDQQRRFVVAYAMSGNATEAARSSGYSDVGGGARVWACRAMQSPKIIAAVREWTEGALYGNGGYVAVAALIEMASDPDHKKRFEAADSLADRVGFARQTNHQVSVEHTDNRSTADLLEAIGRYAEAKWSGNKRIEGRVAVDATVDVQHTVGHETAPSTEPEQVKKKQTDQGVGV